MNIYLDIDGVLLINEKHAAPDADEFLQAVLTKYPDSTYWLTTHCWQGENRAVDVLRPVLQTATVSLLAKVKPTEWDELKTDGIDFSQPFLWFDDDLMPEERAILEIHKVLPSWVGIDLAKNAHQLHDILQSGRLGV